MIAKKIAPAAIVALKEALTNLYWYKSDLRSFLTSTVTHPTLIGRLNWEDYKRNIVGDLVTLLEKQEDQYQPDLLRLMTEVARVDDFSHLERLEGGREKAAAARASVRALRRLTEAHEALFDEQRKMEESRRKAHEQLLRTTAVRERLEQLSREYIALLNSASHQQRGYQLEKILRAVFEIFDLDPRASFKIAGEQIDGAFTFDGTDYLFEGKWQQELVGAAELDSLGGKLSRKLDNTLGLFLSINGFSEDAVRRRRRATSTCVFTRYCESREGVEFDFDELSDGQTLLHCAIKPGTCSIDEPDNFVALAEIQPWLLALKDRVDDAGAQVIVVSHHPEVIDLLAPEHGPPC